MGSSQSQVSNQSCGDNGTEPAFVIPSYLHLTPNQIQELTEQGQQSGVPFHVDAGGAHRPKGFKTKVQPLKNLATVRKTSINLHIEDDAKIFISFRYDSVVSLRVTFVLGTTQILNKENLELRMPNNEILGPFILKPGINRLAMTQSPTSKSCFPGLCTGSYTEHQHDLVLILEPYIDKQSITCINSTDLNSFSFQSQAHAKTLLQQSHNDSSELAPAAIIQIGLTSDSLSHDSLPLNSSQSPGESRLFDRSSFFPADSTDEIDDFNNSNNTRQRNAPTKKNLSTLKSLFCYNENRNSSSNRIVEKQLSHHASASARTPMQIASNTSQNIESTGIIAEITYARINSSKLNLPSQTHHSVRWQTGRLPLDVIRQDVYTTKTMYTVYEIYGIKLRVENKSSEVLKETPTCTNMTLIPSDKFRPDSEKQSLTGSTPCCSTDSDDVHFISALRSHKLELDTNQKRLADYNLINTRGESDGTDFTEMQHPSLDESYYSQAPPRCTDSIDIIEENIKPRGDDNDNAESDGDECVICLTDARVMMVYPCRHLCMCASCSQALPAQQNKCPICRTPATVLLQVPALASAFKGCKTGSKTELNIDDNFTTPAMSPRMSLYSSQSPSTDYVAITNPVPEMIDTVSMTTQVHAHSKITNELSNDAPATAISIASFAYSPATSSKTGSRSRFSVESELELSSDSARSRVPSDRLRLSPGIGLSGADSL